MSMETHLAQLERRHADLERQISEIKNHPSADGIELSNLKRRKLLLKDEIERIRQVVTIH